MLSQSWRPGAPNRDTSRACSPFEGSRVGIPYIFTSTFWGFLLIPLILWPFSLCAILRFCLLLFSSFDQNTLIWIKSPSWSKQPHFKLYSYYTPKDCFHTSSSSAIVEGKLNNSPHSPRLQCKHLNFSSQLSDLFTTPPLLFS